MADGPVSAGASIGEPAVGTTPGRPLRVLVADDGRSAAEILAMFFELEGHEVELAYDGEEALARAQSTMPDLILMDLAMPTMDGVEAARRIRQEPGGRNVVIIALSGFDHDGNDPAGAEAGFDDHLAKPASPDKLREIIRRFGPRFA